jgi:hypothetical protein
MSNPNWNDGAILYGSRQETIYNGAASVGTYILENVSVTRPTNTLKRKDQTGAPLGSVGQPEFITLTATIQICVSATPPVQPGYTFTDTFDTAIGPETFIITETTQPEGQMEYKKQTLNAIKKYN